LVNRELITLPLSVIRNSDLPARHAVATAIRSQSIAGWSTSAVSQLGTVQLDLPLRTSLLKTCIHRGRIRVE